MMSTKILINQPTYGEASYGFDWAREQLPDTMSDTDYNPPLISHDMPVVGQGVPSRLITCHQGSLPWALAAFMLIPDTKTAIIVLSNSLALNDTPD